MKSRAKFIIDTVKGSRWYIYDDSETDFSKEGVCFANDDGTKFIPWTNVSEMWVREKNWRMRKDEGWS
jgi:hypothetical protein